MTTIKATVRDGRLELDVPADWPDGTHVEIHPLHNGSAESDALSLGEIASLLATLDNLEPLEFTDEELVAWNTERHAVKDREKATFMEHATRPD